MRAKKKGERLGASHCFYHLNLTDHLVLCAFGCRMSFLSLLKTAKRAKVCEGMAAARAAARAPPQEPVEAVIRDAPVLRECITKPRFFTYSDMAEGGMAYLQPGYRKTGAAHDEAQAEAQAEAADAARYHDLGHGYVDEVLVVEQMQAMVGCPCPHCSKRTTVSFAGSTRRGIGGGSLDFTCDECGGGRDLQRSRYVPSVGPGRPQEENTLRFVAACVGIGIGYEQTENLALNLNMGTVCKATWDGCRAKCATSARTAREKDIEANLKEEIMLTLLFEGDAAVDKATGKTMIRVITDGSWQKRYGRNSLWGYAAIYGFYTGKEVFVDHRCARCQTCISAKSRGVAVGEHACTKNWAEGQAAGLMERDIVLQGVTELCAKGAIVRTLVVDGDTKTLEWIKKHGPAEVAAVITSELDLNHVAKALGAKLRALMALWKGELKEKQCAALQTAYQNVVYKVRECAPDDESVAEWDEGAVMMRERMMEALDYYFDKRSDDAKAEQPFKSTKLNDIPVPCGKDDAVYLGVKAIFETYSSIALCSKLLFKCSTNTAESGNCVLWVFWLPKTMFKPRSAAMALDLAMLHKAIGRQHAVAAMQGGLGLEVSGLVEAARIKKDKKTKRQGPIFVKSRKTTKTPTPPSFTN